MLHHVLRPRQALNKAYLKQKTPRAEMECFKEQLRLLLDRLDPHESEEHAKNHLRDFLQHTGFHGFGLNTKGRTDLVIHTGPGGKSPAGVLIEVKRPANKADMPSPANLNARATQELLLYYLRERLDHHNHDLKHLVVTSVHTWFVFDALEFDRVFFRKGNLRQQYLDWSQGRKAGTTTDFFYREVAGPALAALAEPLTFAHFDLQDYEKPLRDHNPHNDGQLVALLKLLSPAHLLKLPFANDSNSLDKAFYAELLHLIGLTETKQGGKKLIGRPPAGERNPGSLLENAIDQLESVDKVAYLDRPQQYGQTPGERVFGVALELCITWVNRILFLKLLEAQLLSYHARDPAYAFLSLAKVQNYDDLNSLFFRVLARRPPERAPDVQALFRHVPYLNSSLFEATALEHRTLLISNLRDERTLPLLPGTVLKDPGGKRRTGSLSALAYLFAFLDAYDFSSEGAEAVQEENKRLINASVLGLIFEKINGYRDGSFFTPGFITMYMCRETIRRAALEKFNAAKNWACTSVAELYDRIEDRAEANRIVNSLRVCDPAVGSGHFLVSALNELLSLKSDLRILQDRQGRRLKEYAVEVVNDELVVTDEEGQPFAYRPHHPESQRVQEALFHEKQTLIESCLFGVDINPNSVKICRLRLWIELLKHAYYCQNHDSDNLQTLPNIDINIKVGNSLISRFALDADLREALRKSKWTIGSYKLAVQSYQHARSKEEKREMEALIDTIKGDFRTEIGKKDKKVLRLQRLSGELYNLTQQTTLFTESAKEKKLRLKRLTDLEAELNKLSAEVEEIKSNKLYENAFEWRFEFPEVLSEEGDFVGFDVVIGNPPYGVKAKDEEKSYFKNEFQSIIGKYDSYGFFIEQGVKLLKREGQIGFIVPHTWLTVVEAQSLRNFLLNNCKIHEVNQLPSQVFEDATVETTNLLLEKNSFIETDKVRILIFDLDKKVSSIDKFDKELFVSIGTWKSSGVFNLNRSDEEVKLLNKIKNNSLLLNEICELSVGIQAYDSYAGHSKELISQRIYHSNYKKDDTFIKELNGKDVDRYKFEWPGNTWVSYGNWLAHPRQKKFFDRERILVREITKSGRYSIAGCLSQGFMINYKSILNIILKDEFSKIVNIRFILGVLNSSLMSYYFSLVSNKVITNTFPRISIFDLKVFPIKRVEIQDQESVTALVDKILTAKQTDPAADTSALEAEIDRLVYGLYGLTAEEIALVEGR